MFNRPLHGLRGLASIMVFLAHVISGFHERIYPDDPILDNVVPLLKNFGTFGVEIFFVISGYVITDSCLKYKPREFILRRFMRIYPVFFVFTIFYFCANALLQVSPGRGSPSDLLLNLAFVDIFAGTQSLTPNAWSISLEAWYYVATYFLFHTFVRTSAPRIAGTVGALALVLLIVASFDISAYFVGGVVLQYLHRSQGERLPLLSPAQFVVALGAMVLIAALADFDPRTYFSTPGLQIVAFLLLIATLLSIHQCLHADTALSRLLSKPVFSFLGTISYSLYLVHPYVYMLARVLMQHYHVARIDWTITLPIYFFLVTMVTLTCAWLVNKVVEQGAYRLVFRNSVYRTA